MRKVWPFKKPSWCNGYIHVCECVCTKRKERKEGGKEGEREGGRPPGPDHSNGEFSHRIMKEKTPTQTFSENKGGRNTLQLIS